MCSTSVIVWFAGWFVHQVEPKCLYNYDVFWVQTGITNEQTDCIEVYYLAGCIEVYYLAIISIYVVSAWMYTESK